ncbi:MAG: hypothetical protein WA826_17595 [Silvibacterium sp.]
MPIASEGERKTWRRTRIPASSVSLKREPPPRCYSAATIANISFTDTGVRISSW